MRFKHIFTLGLALAFSLSASAQSVTTPQSDAQKSFDKLKTLAGSWEGHVTTVPPNADIEGKSVHATLRVTSMGNAIMHEMTGDGRPDDPITMLYLDGDRLLLTHYCDAGNRPRMTGASSSDGKTVEFAFLDVAGSTQYGHMDHAVFTPIDANHHTEDWTYIEPGDKPVHAHIDLQRTK
ncbi:MAG TPA: hypothetical protein VFF64_26090 [Candidatus Eremiobacteraceae bacterium]|nr:hypothetical protein [Candidatus Eremiobacteraceae bacterium]